MAAHFPPGAALRSRGRGLLQRTMRSGRERKQVSGKKSNKISNKNSAKIDTVTQSRIAGKKPIISAPTIARFFNRHLDMNKSTFLKDSISQVSVETPPAVECEKLIEGPYSTLAGMGNQDHSNNGKKNKSCILKIWAIVVHTTKGIN